MSAEIHQLFAPRTFVRIYRMPERLIEGYCFGGGVPITFTNVDWFEAIIAEGRAPLVAFIRGKTYYSPSESYLVIGDHPDFTFTIKPGQQFEPSPAEERKP
ncbi:hypothetical protein SAMN05216337_101782 [Bradyrhizobium brasilense]|uniref:Uncharacterized protein n=1 Tax=Bradyrhizobium brasilense TaxID=1419277 RepID=A0A1G6YUT8_9BRAD|nr:hypothetical protein [Bradyrhizobium brasilense]SDD93405.1 hypothetical protein SAMN05216337_101782 [Bradyrhizobium brasilense]